MVAKIAVIYYSLYGHVDKMAKQALEGAKSTGAEVDIYRVAETLPAEVLTKMGAAPKDEAIPVLTPDDLTKYDGFIFCIPTRYGRAVGQFSSLFDQTGGLWAKQALSRKFAAIITSTGTQHGGQEVTALTTLPFLTHHGIIYVPYGYKNPALMQMNTVEGGSPWGASTLAAADGSRQPSQLELDTAKDHGKDFAEIVGIYVKGNTA